MAMKCMCMLCGSLLICCVCYILGVGRGMWYVFGGKTTMACKNAFFNILGLAWYLSWNSLMVSMCVLVRSWIWGSMEMLKDESFLRNFSILDLCCGVRAR